MSDQKQGSRHPAEQAFLESYDPTEFEHPSLAVDLVILTVRDGQLLVALVRRDDHPDKGTWALPGGFVAMHEGLDAAAARVLETKAGQRGVFLEQLYTFGEPGRDPRAVGRACHSAPSSQQSAVSSQRSAISDQQSAVSPRFAGG